VRSFRSHYAVVAFASVSFILAGCAANPKDFGRRPHLTPVGTGLQEKVPPIKIGHARADDETKGSLWRTNGIDLFRDPRARGIGDTLTVKISIKDRATIDSTSSRSKAANSGFNAGAEFDIGLPGFTRAGSGSGQSTVGSTSTHNGQGATSRSETIDLLVAAVVVQVLENGNLVIRGTQEVRVNFEVRVLTVAGIVRPGDVAQDNSISYDKVAEARVSYGGRGRIMEVQQPNWGQQFFDLIMPY
jgi:flagellar L-ring protein FlgH